jgi:hypothetical protein
MRWSKLSSEGKVTPSSITSKRGTQTMDRGKISILP